MIANSAMIPATTRRPLPIDYLVHRVLQTFARDARHDARKQSLAFLQRTLVQVDAVEPFYDGRYESVRGTAQAGAWSAALAAHAPDEVLRVVEIALPQAATPQVAGMGVAYVPENMGIFADLTVKENMLLAARGARHAAEHGSVLQELSLLRG